MLKSEWKIALFAEDFWGKGTCCSFVVAATGEMAGHVGRGRGRGRGGRFEDDQWGGRGGGGEGMKISGGGGAPRWWNPGFPHGPFPLPP
jgi:hypothetical protein